jgi:hypothetical protein
MRCVRSLRPALIALLLSAPAASVAAQVRVLDEGSFTIFRGDTRVGREDFSIRATADATGPLAAQGTVAIDTRRLQPALAVTASGVPVSYQLEIREGRDVTARWALQIAGGRAVSRQRSASGEASTEFPAPVAAVLFDDQVAHHAWFVLRRSTAGRVPVLRPRDGVAGALLVSGGTADTVVIGGRPSAARRFVLTPDWDLPPRDVWVDAAGRVLQVRLGPQGLRYVRDEGPAGS